MATFGDMKRRLYERRGDIESLMPMQMSLTDREDVVEAAFRPGTKACAFLDAVLAIVIHENAKEQFVGKA
jgi:hypothetical protein